MALIIIPLPPCFLPKLPREEQVCVKSHMTASPLFCSSDYGLSCFKEEENSLILSFPVISGFRFGHIFPGAVKCKS